MNDPAPVWRHLDVRGMLAYAADVARERTHENMMRVRFAVADERAGILALANLDTVKAWGESDRLALMRRLLAEA